MEPLTSPDPQWMIHGGEMGQRIREFPWEATPVDAQPQWSPALRYTLQNLLHNSIPSFLLWGEDGVLFYNDAYRKAWLEEEKHPRVLGLPAAKVWPAAWPELDRILRQLRQNGKPLTWEHEASIANQQWQLSPVFGDGGMVEGVLVHCTGKSGLAMLLRELIEQSSVPSALFSGKAMFLDVANNALLKAWSKDRSIIGKPFLKIFPEMEGQEFVALIQEARESGKPVSGNDVLSWHLREDGEKEAFYWNIECLPYAEGEVGLPSVFVKASNITQQVAHRNALAIAEDEMRVALEAANIGYWNVNPVNNTLKCNRKTKELFGLPPDEEVDLLLAINNIHEDDRQRVIDRINTVLQYSSGGLYDIEYRVVSRVNGSISYVRAIGKSYFNDKQEAYRFSGTVQDITAKKRLEEELRNSESKYRSLFENMDQGFSIIELMFDEQGLALDYTFIEVNDRFTKQTGITGAQGKTVKELIPVVERHWIDRYASIALTGQPLHFIEESSALGKWFEVFAFRFDEKHPNLVALLFTDITARKEADHALQAEKQFTQSIIEAAPSLTYIFNLDNTSNAFVSSQISDILGYSREEVKDMGTDVLVTLLHPDDMEATSKRFEKLVQDREDATYEVEYRMRHKDGQWVWLFDRAKVFKRNAGEVPVQILGVATEISTRKKAEAAVLESENRFRTIANTLAQLVWVCSPDGLVQWQNERAKHFFGGYYLGDSWMQFLHPDDVKTTVDLWNQAVDSGGVFEVEYRLYHAASETYRWFLVKALPFRDAEGMIANWFGTCTDIHDQKSMTQSLEALVRERTKALQRSNEDLQQFAHVASHDLKEPVRKIRMFMNRLQDEMGSTLPEEGQVYIDKVQRAAARMSLMIDGILQFSSLDAQQVLAEQVDLNMVLRDVQHDLELAIQQKSASIEAGLLPAVTGSPLLMHQLLYNLVFNALKFSKAAIKPQIRVYSEGPEDGKVSIIVEDNGIGFRQGDGARIFGTFVRLHPKDQYEGTGLGLALCQKIVERHGGTITGIGEEGKGAKFIITLPERVEQ